MVGFLVLRLECHSLLYCLFIGRVTKNRQTTSIFLYIFFGGCLSARDT